MSFIKTVKTLAKNHTVLFTIVAAVALCYVMKNYSQGKGLGGMAGYENQNAQHGSAPAGNLPNSALSDRGAAGYKLNL